LKGTAGGTRYSSCRRAIRLAPGMWLALYSPASLTSIRANGSLPSSRLLSDAGAIVAAMGAYLRAMRRLKTAPYWNP